MTTEAKPELSEEKEMEPIKTWLMKGVNGYSVTLHPPTSEFMKVASFSECTEGHFISDSHLRKREEEVVREIIDKIISFIVNNRYDVYADPLDQGTCIEDTVVNDSKLRGFLCSLYFEEEKRRGK